MTLNLFPIPSIVMRKENSYAQKETPIDIKEDNRKGRPCRFFKVTFYPNEMVFGEVSCVLRNEEKSKNPRKH